MTVESQILNAARELGATRSKDVRIRDIRDALPKVSPKQFDQAMQVLHDSKKIAIYRDDTSSAVSSVGAYLVNGKLRHLLYLL
jgi:DNA-binding MurR/RpiR family transcriptional regulator